MSNQARKARKRAGIKFEPKPQKLNRVATPLIETAWYNAMFMGVKGTQSAGNLVPRSFKKRVAALESRGLFPSNGEI